MKKNPLMLKQLSILLLGALFLVTSFKPLLQVEASTGQNPMIQYTALLKSSVSKVENFFTTSSTFVDARGVQITQQVNWFTKIRNILETPFKWFF
jgi:hypothetical protein